MSLTRWKLIDSRYLIRDPWMTLRADRCELPNGKVLDPYYVQEPPDWVQIVAFDSQDRILITRQYRHAAGIVSTELPCGTVEPNEPPGDTARRELLEETGCIADTWQALPALSPNPARFTNRAYVFLALNTRQVQAQTLEETEDIEFEFMALAEVLALIERGLFPQAIHIASLFLAMRVRGLSLGGDTPR